MSTINININLKKLLYLGVIFSLFLFNQCKSKIEINVEKKEFIFGPSFVTDTIKIKSNKEDVSWKLTTDNYWIIVDSQLNNGSKEVLWSVLENLDSASREANVYLTGQDIDTIKIKVIQSKGNLSEVVEQKNTEKKQITKTNKSKKIIVENQVEEIQNEGEESAQTESTKEKPVNKISKPMKDDENNTKEINNTEKKENIKKEKPKSKMDISVDEIILGAANNLESNSITIESTESWKIKGALPDWLSILNATTNKETLTGEGEYKIKFKTLSSNSSTTLRKATVDFQMGKLTKSVKVTQKPTEAELILSSSDIKIPGEQGEEPISVNIKAINTQWEIDKTTIPEWIKLSTISGGVGETTINIKALINETNQTRNLKLNLISTGGVIKKELNITQDIQSVKIKISPLSNDLTEKAESFATFTVTSNVEWEIIKNEEIAWYNLDVTNGTGGEDNVETVTVTAQENNEGEERLDTITVVAQGIKRKVIIKQKGKVSATTTTKDIKLIVSIDSIDLQKDLLSSTPFVLEITTNDKWTINNLPEWLDAYSLNTKLKVTGGDGTDKIELKVNKDKDSIKYLKFQNFVIQSVNAPNVKQTIVIKSKESNVKKEIKVTGLSKGNFLPYIEIGNISKQLENSQPVKSPTTSIQVYSSVDFSLNLSSKSLITDKFYNLFVDKIPYILGDIISGGNHEITFTATSDNVLEKQMSKTHLLQFAIDEQVFTYIDNTTGKEGISEFELKQEPFVLSSLKPKVYITDLSFNGYSSYILLGNPKVKQNIDDTSKLEPFKKTIKIKTDKPIKILVIEDKAINFDIYYSDNPDKINNVYKIGKVLNEGNYYFSFEAKKNYKDPNGFNTRDTRTLVIEPGEKIAKNTENNAEEQKNLIFIDTKNKDYSGSSFRSEFLVEQESMK